MKNKGTVIFWGVVILIGVGVATFFGIRNMIRANTVAPFKPHLESYLALAKPAQPEPFKEPKQGGPQPYVKGKIITVDVKEKEIDYVYFELPEELCAARPEEVGTVVLLSWDKEQVGFYEGGGGAAYVQTCLVTMVDKTTNTVVAENVPFHGSDPPPSKKRSESGTGSKPTDQVAKYLSSLPRK